MSLRRLTADDLAAYKALRDLMLREHPSAYTSDAETESRQPAESYAARIGTPAVDDARFTIGAWLAAAPADGGADDRPVLVGAISCERDARRKARHIGHLTAVMVHPGQQGRGIGGRLLAAGIAAARRADGVDLLTLSVTAGNASALALYRRAGFRRYGKLPRALKLGDEYHAKELMALDLSTLR